MDLNDILEEFDTTEKREKLIGDLQYQVEWDELHDLLEELLHLTESSDNPEPTTEQIQGSLGHLYAVQRILQGEELKEANRTAYEGGLGALKKGGG